MNVFVVLGLRYKYKEKYVNTSAKDYSPKPVSNRFWAAKTQKRHNPYGCVTLWIRVLNVSALSACRVKPHFCQSMAFCRSPMTQNTIASTVVTRMLITGKCLPVNICTKDRYIVVPCDDMLHWSNGNGLPNRYYDRQPRRVRDIQDVAILETFISHISKLACRMLRDQDERCAVKYMRPYARKYLYETGLPDKEDQYWDYTLASHIIDLFHAGSLSDST